MTENIGKMPKSVDGGQGKRQVARRRHQYLEIIKCWHTVLSVIVVITVSLNLHACERSSYYSHDRAEAFLAHFEEGMSRDEVEQRLAELGDFDLIDESIFPDGDVGLVYRTPGYRQWGANGYVFRFTPDWRLVVVFPVVP